MWRRRCAYLRQIWLTPWCWETPVSAEDRQRLGTSLKRLKAVPIVMFCKMSDSRILRELADEQVESHEDPRSLLDALERVLPTKS